MNYMLMHDRAYKCVACMCRASYRLDWSSWLFLLLCIPSLPDWCRSLLICGFFHASFSWNRVAKFMALGQCVLDMPSKMLNFETCWEWLEALWLSSPFLFSVVLTRYDFWRPKKANFVYYLNMICCRYPEYSRLLPCSSQQAAYRVEHLVVPEGGVVLDYICKALDLPSL